MSIDATDCPIAETHPIDKDFYSFKFHAAGLKYEIAVSIHGGNIVWVYGGVPCGIYSDLTLARESFVDQLLPNEKAVADGVYRDNRYFITPLYNPDSIQAQKEIRARHEKVNGIIKRFHCLTTVFRHHWQDHSFCFFAVAQIVHLIIEYDEPLYELNLL